MRGIRRVLHEGEIAMENSVPPVGISISFAHCFSFIRSLYSLHSLIGFHSFAHCFSIIHSLVSIHSRIVFPSFVPMVNGPCPTIRSCYFPLDVTPYLGRLIKFHKQFVKRFDENFDWKLGGHVRIIHNIGIQNGHVGVMFDV